MSLTRDPTAFAALIENLRDFISNEAIPREDLRHAGDGDAILGFPAVTIRQAHERPEGMDEGTLIMCGIAPDPVLRGIEIVMAQHAEGLAPRMAPDYDAGCVSAKVVRIILSYTDYVRSTVWRER